MKSRKLSIATTLFRVIIAGVFIFSGFVKSIDPWGTAMKIEEYLSVVNFDFSESIYMTLSFLLCGGELLLGLLLLFGLYKRFSSALALAFMAFMTLLTLWIAIWNPVVDCGCFGDAFKLSNWETFAKNIALLPISFMLWRAWSRVTCVGCRSTMGVSLVTLSILSFGLCLYSYRHLPMIDFLPYKVGVDLLSDFNDDVDEDVDETILVYRDRVSNELTEFTLEDTTWYDNRRWEYVETIVDEPSGSDPINEFALFNGEDFVTNDLLEGEQVLLISVWDISRPISEKCMRGLVKLIDESLDLGYRIYCMTPSSLEQYPTLNVGGVEIETFNIDGKTLKSTLRSHIGVVEVDNGVVVSKRSCHDIAD